MKQSFAIRVDVHNAGVASGQKPVNFVVLACCAQLEDGSVVVDNLYYVNVCSVTMACTSIGWGGLEFTYSWKPRLLRDQNVVHKNSSGIGSPSRSMSKLVNPSIVIVRYLLMACCCLNERFHRDKLP
jgi:hypothetical protein